MRFSPGIRGIPAFEPAARPESVFSTSRTPKFFFFWLALWVSHMLRDTDHLTAWEREMRDWQAILVLTAALGLVMSLFAGLVDWHDDRWVKRRLEACDQRGVELDYNITCNAEDE